MHVVSLLGAAAALCGSAAAIPAPAPEATPEPRLDARDAYRYNLHKRVEPTAAWVTVDDEGRPAKTYSPSMTTISGTPSAIDGAPHDLTASVYTWTTWGDIITSTGTPPNPTATGKSSQGSFSRCYNLDGDFAPFCRPSSNSTLLTGNTYYITWDPDYYNKTGASSNTTYDITVRLDYLNWTSNEYVKLESFDNNRVPAAWGFFPLTVDKSLLKGERINNVTITLLSAPHNTNDKKNSVALPIAITTPGLPVNKPPKPPTGKTLYIALPVSLGTIAFLLIGVCLWNAKTRRIQLGSVMGRGRRGYSGRKLRQDVFRSKRDNGIQLDNAIVTPANHYRDAPEHVPAARRDSDGLDSLAESPVEGAFDFEHQGTTGGNAFRDELSRQENERRHAY